MGPFARDGFALLERFLDRDAAIELAADVDAAVAGPRDPACERPHNTLLPLRFDDRIVAEVLACERRVEALATVVGAEDLRWISGYVSVKDARSPALWWHQDWWCWDHPVTYRPAAAQVAVLCYLADTDVDNGALRVLPGSHHRSCALHGLLPEAHADPEGGPGLDPAGPALSDHPDQVTVCVRAGDAVVIDYRLLHGTHANRSDARRDCLLLSFAPSWRDLPADVRAHLIRHPAQPGDDERRPGDPWAARLLPSFDGARADLPLNRIAPARFAIAR